MSLRQDESRTEIWEDRLCKDVQRRHHFEKPRREASELEIDDPVYILVSDLDPLGCKEICSVD